MLNTTHYLKKHMLIQCLSFMFVFFCIFSLSAQTYLTTELSNIKELEKNKTEKVYLQLDRTIFSPGEDIWFKAYLLEGTYHTLTSSTNNLHVEIIAPNGKIKTSQVVLMHEGVGYGDIKLLHEDFKDGVYEIRAYTNFMRNFNDAIFYKQNIIIKGSDKTEQRQQKTDAVIDLQFFPEGGQLVYNVLNRVAFKAIDQNGKGKNVSITVFDNDNNEVQKTESVHNGMGQFMFTPKSNTTYHAVINNSGSESQKINLPQASSTYSILVGNQFKNLLDFTICTSPENAKGQQISYVIQSRGKLFSSNKIKMDNETKLVRIEKEQLPAGISSITIFDDNGIPVCERLVYNQLSPKVQINISTNKEDYDTREKVTLCIETKNEAGKPVPANLSLAVIGKHIADKQKEMLPDNSGILSSILLRSDLKGQIENPDYYFENFNRKKHHYLDLVLLTHGWRKYVWKEKVATPNLTMDYNYENGFTFTGTSRTLLLNSRIANSKVTLVTSENGFFYDEVTTDEEGRFTFTDIPVMDSTDVMFQAYNKRDKRNTTIMLDEQNYGHVATTPVKQFFESNSVNNLQDIAQHAELIKRIRDSLNTKNHKNLEEITVKGRRIEKDGHFRLHRTADQVIKIDYKDIVYTNMIHLITDKLIGETVYGACPNVQITFRGSQILDGTAPAQFLLDGMWVESSDICAVPPNLVDKIEVLRGTRAAVYGSRGFGGIIAIYLQHNAPTFDYPPFGVEKMVAKGYYLSREFYSPNYEMEQEEFTGADYRNTTHWEPFISTDKEGKAELSFFNSDDSGDFKITVEGVGLNGGLGKTEINYTVAPDGLSNR